MTSLIPPPERLKPDQYVRLIRLIEKHARLEVGIRLGYLEALGLKPEGELSFANDMADTIDKIRELVLGSSDHNMLAKKFGYDKE